MQGSVRPVIRGASPVHPSIAHGTPVSGSWLGRATSQRSTRPFQRAGDGGTQLDRVKQL